MKKSFITTILVAVIAGGLSAYLFAPKSTSSTQKASAYERVVQTKTLKCGYVILPPELNKDPNTGKLSGMSFDIVEEMAKRLNIKVNWAEEVNFGTMYDGLESGRYDAICFSLYRYSPAAWHADYTVPLFYSATDAYVRADDNRFNASTDLNNPAIKIATIDGEMAAIIAKERFPKATAISMPQMTDLSQMMMNVVTGKADITFMNSLAAANFLKSNPGKLKKLNTKPLMVFSHGIAVGKYEQDLVATFNTVINEMHDHGFIEKTIAQHQQLPGSYLAITKPYEAAQ